MIVFQWYDPLTETGSVCVFPVDPVKRMPLCLNARSVPSVWTLPVSVRWSMPLGNVQTLVLMARVHVTHTHFISLYEALYLPDTAPPVSL